MLEVGYYDERRQWGQAVSNISRREKTLASMTRAKRQ